MSAASERQVPLQRLAIFASLAEATKTEQVLVVCRGRDVAKQYRRAVTSAGGKRSNLHFVYLDEVPR
jgi:hypothetical protein